MHGPLNINFCRKFLLSSDVCIISSSPFLQPLFFPFNPLRLSIFGSSLYLFLIFCTFMSPPHLLCISSSILLYYPSFFLLVVTFFYSGFTFYYYTHEHIYNLAKIVFQFTYFKRAVLENVQSVGKRQSTKQAVVFWVYILIQFEPALRQPRNTVYFSWFSSIFKRNVWVAP